MAPPVIRSFGRLTMGADQNNMVVDMPSRKPGDILFIHAFGYSAGAANASLPETPAGFEALHPVDDTSAFSVLFAGRVYDADVQITLAAGVGQDVDVWSIQAWSVTNVTPATTWYDDTASDNAGGSFTTPAVTVSGTDRMVLHYFHVSLLELAPGTVSAVEGGYTFYPDLTANLSSLYVDSAWITKVTDASEPARSYETDTGLGSHRIFSLAIIGADLSLLPALPQPNQLRFECAETYTVFITDVDYETRIDRVYSSQLRWGRILDEASQASVTVPDVYGGLRCCIPYGGIEPWRFGVLVERNDQEVWSGAVTSIQRDREAGTTQLGCTDVLSRMAKRLATRTDIKDWVNTDAGVAFAELINETAKLSSDPWFLQAPEVFTGSTVTRKLLPRKFEKASAVIKELADSSIDFFVMNGVLYVWEPSVGWTYINRGPKDSSRVGFLAAQIGHNPHKSTLDGPYNNNYDLVYGLFTEAAFATSPRWGVDGMNQGNFVVVAGTDQGEFGAREYWSAQNGDSQATYGVLDDVETNPLHLPSDSPPAATSAALQAHANSYLALHALAPLTVEGGILARGAPVDVDNLIPGSLWGIDIWDHCYGQLLAMMRLKSVTVDVTWNNGRLVEQVSPTLYPPGAEGVEV